MSHEMLWTQIHDEREALLADLEKLTDEQWRTPSLCEGWTVQNVVAHLVSAASTSKVDAAKELVKFKGNVGAMMHHAVDKYSNGTPAETLEAYRASIHERKTPSSPDAMLGDIVVHGEDIRRPLGLTREYPAETLREIADYYKDSQLGTGAKKRIAGLHLMATDQEWGTGKGAGEVVSGPILALIMTMTGRKAYLDDLSGEGLLTYNARFTK